MLQRCQKDKSYYFFNFKRNKVSSFKQKAATDSEMWKKKNAIFSFPSVLWTFSSTIRENLKEEMRAYMNWTPDIYMCVFHLFLSNLVREILISSFNRKLHLCLPATLLVKIITDAKTPHTTEVIFMSILQGIN